MLCFPNCKINIGLYITNKRQDGFHDLETVFYPVKLRDVLEAVPGVAEMHVHGKVIVGDARHNLVWKAYEMLLRIYPAVKPLEIHLLKNIPMGAGLGGGSADGAFMLQLLNDHYKLGIARDTLADMALELGSDCPFFIYNTPQFASGRGELMEPIAIDLSGYSIQLVCPDVHISTAASFKMMTPRPAPFDLKKLAALPIANWKENIANDFEVAVFEMHPQLSSIKQQLYAGGALYASMSGSGSSLYGIFEKGGKAAIETTVPFETHYIK